MMTLAQRIVNLLDRLPWACRAYVTYGVIARSPQFLALGLVAPNCRGCNGCWCGKFDKPATTMMITLIGGALIVMTLFLAWAMMAVAKRADDDLAEWRRELEEAWPSVADLPDGEDIFEAEYGPATGKEAEL